MKDSLQRFVLNGAPVRGQIVTLDDAWLEVVGRHELPASVRDRLGELSAAALMLSASLKFDGSLILQIHGDGPVALFVVECDAKGTFRATVKLREGQTVPENAQLAQLVDVHGRGRFVVTLDPRTRAPNRQPYQGIVPLDAGSVAGTLEHYMASSEQVPTRMWLAADGRRSVGLLLQRLPDDGGKPGAAGDEDGWERMCQLAATITHDELLGLPPEQVLERLFWDEPLRGLDQRACRFACSCSHARVTAMLRMLGRAEVDSVLRERERVEVTCEFCNRRYEFDVVDCAGVFVEGFAMGGSGPH